MKKLVWLFLLIPSLVWAAFSDSDKLALRTAALAEPSIQQCITDGNDTCVADWFNATSAFVVWRKSVTQTEYQTAISSSGTSFDWSSTGGFIARSQGERDAWRTMFSPGSVNPSQLPVRNAFNDIFSGTGAGAVNNRAHLTAISQRFARNGERILATGIGTSLSPGLLTFEGAISVNQIPEIMRP